MLLHGFAELSIGEQGQGFAAPGSISSASDEDWRCYAPDCTVTNLSRLLSGKLVLSGNSPQPPTWVSGQGRIGPGQLLYQPVA